MHRSKANIIFNVRINVRVFQIVKPLENALQFSNAALLIDTKPPTGI